MPKSIQRLLIGLSILAVCAAAMSSWLGSGAAHADLTTPSGTVLLTGSNVPVYATPALLGAATTAHLTAGSIVNIPNVGQFGYQPSCPDACDGCPVGNDAGVGCSCIPANGADGGFGCWMRNRGGIPGAQNRSAWYSDSSLGNDANDCQAAGAASSPGGHGACKTFGEPWRRIAHQTFDGSLGIYPVLMFTGDFSAENVDVDIYMTNLPFITIQCTRTYAGAGLGADGGGYTGFVSQAVAWDGGSHQEGVYTVTAAADGGAAFGASATTEDGGYMLELTSGVNVGGSIIIGETRDAGTFESPGGQLGFSGIEAAAGTGVRLYRPTRVGTTVSIRLHGNGDVAIQDCDFGPQNNAAHSTIITSDSIDALLVPLSSTLRGVDSMASVNLQPIGSTITHEDIYGGGYTYCTSSLLSSHVRPRVGGLLSLGDRCMVNGDGLSPSIGDGSDYGSVTVVGGSMVSTYPAAGGVVIDYPGSLSIQAPFWVRGQTGATGPAIMVQSGIVATYTSGNAPAATGVAAASPWKVAGTSYSSLPQATGFVVLQ